MCSGTFGVIGKCEIRFRRKPRKIIKHSGLSGKKQKLKVATTMEGRKEVKDGGFTDFGGKWEK